MWQLMRSLSPTSLQWAPAFHSTEHEARFRQEQELASVRLDNWSSKAAWWLFAGASLRYLRYVDLWDLVAILWPWALLLVLLSLAPSIYSLLWDGSTYPRARMWCIAALRVASIGLLNSSFWDVLRSTGTDFPQSRPRQLALVMLMARVPTYWVAGFCFRLPFFLHSLVDGLIVWSSLLGLPSKCLAQAAHAPQPLREAFFAEAFQQVQGIVFSIPVMALGPEGAHATLCASPAGGATSAAGAGASGGAGSLHEGLPESPPGLDGSCCCSVVVGLVMVLLSYVVPCVVVALAEVQARAHYMAAHMGEEGWEQKDILDHAMSNCVGSTVRFACLLPAMVALAWHLVVWAVVPLPAGGAPAGY